MTANAHELEGYHRPVAGTIRLRLRDSWRVLPAVAFNRARWYDPCAGVGPAGVLG